MTFPNLISAPFRLCFCSFEAQKPGQFYLARMILETLIPFKPIPNVLRDWGTEQTFPNLVGRNNT